MGLNALTQDERLELCFFARLYLVHWELPGKTLYMSDRNYKYDYGSVQYYENYLFDLGNLSLELLRVTGNRNFKITLNYRNDRILDKDYLIELADDYRFIFSTLKIYELRLVENGETFASDVKTLMFRGVCGKPYEITRRSFKIDVHNIMLAKRDLLPLTVIDADTYPSADPDDLGKKDNTIYGSVPHVPCMCVESGAVDNVKEEIDESDTSIELSDASEFESSGTIGIDDEEITYTGISSNTLTGCTRGANSTTAQSHSQGAAVWQVMSRFVYKIARHPVKAVSDVYVDGYRITDVATIYTGQTGDELSGYEGTAVFTVPARITRQAAIDLLVNDGIDVDDAIAIVDTIDVDDTTDVNDGISVSDGISVADTIAVVDTIGVNDPGHDHDSDTSEVIADWRFDTAEITDGSPDYPYNLIDGNLDTYANLPSAYPDEITLSRSFYQDYPGTPYQYRVCARSGALSAGINIYFDGALRLSFSSSEDDTAKKSSWISVGTSLDTWTEWNAAECVVQHSGSAVVNNYMAEVWIEVKYTPSGTSEDEADVTKTGSASKSGTVTKTGTVTKSGTVTKEGTVTKTGSASRSGTVTKTGTVTLTGNSVADVTVGTVVTATVDGYQDDASGTITGTANALIERPDHVIEHILTVLLGESASDIGSSFAVSGAAYGSTYKFGFILHEVADQADQLMQRLAFQCRSKFQEWRGKFELVYMGSAPSAARTFTDDDLLEEPVFGATDEIDIKNLIYVYYDRDYRESGQSAYRGVWKGIDNDSITDNGQRIETIELTACRNESMALDWTTWYLTQESLEWRTLKMTVPWAGKVLSAGDTVGLTWDFYSGLTWDLVGVEVDKAREKVAIKGQEWPS